MSDKRILSNAKRDLAGIRRFIDAVGPRDLERAFDKGQHRQVDGFPAGGDGARSSEVSDPTGNAVVRRLGRLDSDPVADALRGAFDKLHTVYALLVEVEHAFDLERHVTETTRQRNAPAGQGDCMVDHGVFCSGAQDDRLKGGFCHSCFVAWTRYIERNPGGDRARFIAERRAKLTELGEGAA